MTPSRKTSIGAGGLLVIATVAALAAAAVQPGLTGAGYLIDVGDHPQRLAAAALLYLVAAAGSVGIAIVLYPMLATVNATWAVGAVVFRTIEAVMYTAAVVNLLNLRNLGAQATVAASGSRPSAKALADTVLSAHDHANLIAVFAFSLGVGMYYALLYRARLVPRWLSGWGITGAALIFAACLMALFADTPVTGYTLLIAPIAVQEMVFAAWLLFKGFARGLQESPRVSTAARETAVALAFSAATSHR